MTFKSQIGPFGIVLWVLLVPVLHLLAPPMARAQECLQTIPRVNPRLVVISDLSNGPDDAESLVRLLVYSDQFDIEGRIASTSTWLRRNPREDGFRRDPAAYAQVQTNLLKHAAFVRLPARRSPGDILIEANGYRWVADM